MQDLLILYRAFEVPIAAALVLLAIGLTLQHFNAIASKRREEEQDQIIQHMIEQEEETMKPLVDDNAGGPLKLDR